VWSVWGGRHRGGLGALPGAAAGAWAVHVQQRTPLYIISNLQVEGQLPSSGGCAQLLFYGAAGMGVGMLESSVCGPCVSVCLVRLEIPSRYGCTLSLRHVTQRALTSMTCQSAWTRGTELPPKCRLHSAQLSSHVSLCCVGDHARAHGAALLHSFGACRSLGNYRLAYKQAAISTHQHAGA
jgi:hypothetical protein